MYPFWDFAVTLYLFITSRAAAESYRAVRWGCQVANCVCIQLCDLFSFQHQVLVTRLGCQVAHCVSLRLLAHLTKNSRVYDENVELSIVFSHFFIAEFSAASYLACLLKQGDF